MSIPFRSPSPFLLLLHLHFCHRLPGTPPAQWLWGFICHLPFPRPSLSISARLPHVCVRARRVRLCAAANSFPLSRQTANCCCCKERGSPLFLTLVLCSPATERMRCVVLLEQMIAFVRQRMCAASSGVYRLLCLYCRSVSAG